MTVFSNHTAALRSTTLDVGVCIGYFYVAHVRTYPIPYFYAFFLFFLCLIYLKDIGQLRPVERSILAHLPF